jgi:hypothetical protein
VNDACPLLPVMFQPVNPALGPETTVKVTLEPTTGSPVPTTLAVTVCEVPTGFMLVAGAKTMLSKSTVWPMVLLSNVTAPLSANTLPSTVAPVFTVIDV